MAAFVKLLTRWNPWSPSVSPVIRTFTVVGPRNNTTFFSITTLLLLLSLSLPTPLSSSLLLSLLLLLILCLITWNFRMGKSPQKPFGYRMNIEDNRTLRERECRKINTFMLLKLKVNLCACQYIRTKKMSRRTKCRQEIKNPLCRNHISIKNINLRNQTLKKTTSKPRFLIQFPRLFNSISQINKTPNIDSHPPQASATGYP